MFNQFKKRIILIILLFFIILYNSNCTQNKKITFSIENKELKIETSKKKDKINLEHSFKEISNQHNLIKSHEIPGGDFYTITPFPVELGIEWGKDKVAYLVIYFDYNYISKYSEKYDNIEIIIESNKKITLDNGMDIDDIIKLLNSRNIKYENIEKYLIKVYFDKEINFSFNEDTRKIYDISIFFEKIIKSKDDEQVLVEDRFFSPKISNLRFRETPDLNGKFIRFLNQSEKLKLIEIGKIETIDRIKGSWMKVKTEKGEIGWCFDAYLKEVK